MWEERGKEAQGTPDGLLWKVPYISVLPLDTARAVMQSMEMKYVWWDWMCVPQGNRYTLSPELLKVKGEEISKQMVIYKESKKSIVWVHRTELGNHSTLEKFLLGKLPARENIQKYMEDVQKTLKNIQVEEPWLTSVWTLQEGVLLSETILLDMSGAKLPGPKFYHNDGHASVIDLTVGITQFVINVAKAFMWISEADNADNLDDTPIGDLVQFIRSSKENYDFIACILARIIRTGLVSYAGESPLYILAGKDSRRCSQPEDKCWALLGALELEGIKPWYSEGRDMDQVNAVFFSSLLMKYQLKLLIVPEINYSLSWPKRVVEGTSLPLGVFFGIHLYAELPELTWEPEDIDGKDRLVLKARESSSFSLIQLHGLGFHRRYEQIDGFIRVHSIERVSDPLKEKLLFLPVADMEPAQGRKGKRCISIEKAYRNLGYFKGIVDIFSTDDSITKITYPNTEFSDYRLLGSKA
ncbi:hypothetical protein EYZ11_008956 [Aspergillus tanneri]|nr:hypothetical protein EYZ11_008956 [Aspergillus tanneri]